MEHFTTACMKMAITQENLVLDLALVFVFDSIVLYLFRLVHVLLRFLLVLELNLVVRVLVLVFDDHLVNLVLAAFVVPFPVFVLLLFFLLFCSCCILDIVLAVPVFSRFRLISLT